MATLTKVAELLNVDTQQPIKMTKRSTPMIEKSLVLKLTKIMNTKAKPFIKWVGGKGQLI